MRLLPRSHQLFPLASLAILGAGPVTAQDIREQYRSPAGVIYLSLPDTGAVARALGDYRSSPTVENALALGAAQSSVRQYREAIRTYSNALLHHPGHPDLLRWRGHRFLTLRDFGRAEEDLKLASEQDSMLYGAWYHLGIVQFANGKHREAARSFARALPLAPNPGELAGSVDWLWLSLMNAGRPDAASALLARRPDSLPAGNAYSRRLALYRGEIGPDAVITAGDTADVQVATLAFGLAQWHRLRGDTASARAAYDIALGATGGWPGFAFIVSELHRREMRPPMLKQIADRDPAWCPAGARPVKYTRVSAKLLLEGSEIDSVPPANLALIRQMDGALTRVAMEIRREIAGREGGPLGDAEPRFEWDQLQGNLALVVYRNGRARTFPTRPVAMSRERDFEFVRQLAERLDRLIGERTVLFGWPPALAADSVVVDVSVDTGREAFLSEAASRASTRRRLSDPMFTVRVPEEGALASPRSGSGPRYPNDLNQRGIEGTVRLRFEVDSVGRPDLTTITDVFRVEPRGMVSPESPEYATFRAAVVSALGRVRYQPATIGGCPVRQLVQQPFIFAIERD